MVRRDYEFRGRGQYEIEARSLKLMDKRRSWLDVTVKIFKSLEELMLASKEKVRQTKVYLCFAT